MINVNTATLADQYINGQAVEPTAEEVATFTDWVNGQFERIERRVQFTPDEVSPERMQHYWNHYGLLLISTAHNEHPFWSEETNARFRAIHDWDHIAGRLGFDMAGELCAAVYAMEAAPESIRWILYSEIALQAAAAIHTGQFQPQKLVRV